jgi:hypothetical protein
VRGRGCVVVASGAGGALSAGGAGISPLLADRFRGSSAVAFGTGAGLGADAGRVGTGIGPDGVALDFRAGGVDERWTGGPPTKRGLGVVGPVGGGGTDGGGGRWTRGGASESNSSRPSKAELLGVRPRSSAGPSTSVAVGWSERCSPTSLKAGGGLTMTMPPHLGQARICPMADGSRTLSRVLHVVQVIAKSSMPLASYLARVPRRARSSFRIVCGHGPSQGGRKGDRLLARHDRPFNGNWVVLEEHFA